MVVGPAEWQTGRMDARADIATVRVPARRWRDIAMGTMVVASAAGTLAYLLLGLIAGYEGRLGHDDVIGIVTWSISPLVGIGATVVLWRRRPSHPLLVPFATIASLPGVAQALFAVPDISEVARSDAAIAMPLVIGSRLLTAASIVGFVTLAATFPDGRFLRRVERVAVRCSWVAFVPVVVMALSVELVPFPIWTDYGLLVNPWQVGPVVDAGVAQALQGVTYAVPLPAALLLLTRYRHLGPGERRRTRWVLLPVLLSAWAVLVDLVLGTVVGPDVTLFTAALVPASLYVGLALGLVAPDAEDVDRVMRRWVVYGVLWATVAGVYVGVSAAIGVVAGNRLPVEWAILLTIVATMVFQPARRWLERAVDRWVFGRRADPTRIVAHLGDALAGGPELATVLPRMAAALEEGLGLEWARVRLEPDGSEPSADEPVPVLRVPVEHDGEVIGVVECGPKVAGSVTDEDRAVVETLARQAALAVGNVRLARELVVRADQLTESRARLVRAQQHERRRIERDLHDGVQQDVVGLMALVGAMRLDASDDEAAELAALQQGLARVLSDIRELAAGIHPSVLTDLGLVASVEALANRNAVPARVLADDRVSAAELPDEVAAVAYFTVAEALANSAKHAAASDVEVVLERLDGALRVTVRDDGVGFDRDAASDGQGLRNLAERVDALDGTLEVVTGPGVDGTVLRATLAVPGRVPSAVPAGAQP